MRGCQNSAAATEVAGVFGVVHTCGVGFVLRHGTDVIHPNAEARGLPKIGWIITLIEDVWIEVECGIRWWFPSLFKCVHGDPWLLRGGFQRCFYVLPRNILEDGGAFEKVPSETCNCLRRKLFNADSSGRFHIGCPLKTKDQGCLNFKVTHLIHTRGVFVGVNVQPLLM